MAAISKLRPARRQLFPEKLFDLVNKPNSGISWSPDGTKIEVERTQLEKSIADKFRSQNYDSFIRQLHFYGFRKSGNSYYHEKFQRDDPSQLQSMRRKYSNSPLDHLERNFMDYNQTHHQQPVASETLRSPRHSTARSHDQESPIDARKSTLSSQRNLINNCNINDNPLVALTLSSNSKTSTISATSGDKRDAVPQPAPPAHENRTQLISCFKQLRSSNNYSAQNYAFLERDLPSTACSKTIQYSRPIIMYTLDEQQATQTGASLNSSDNHSVASGNTSIIDTSNGLVNAGSSTTSFTTIRSDVTQASIAGNMLQIEIPRSEAGPDGPKWPKTLVLENFSTSNGGFITAYWVQSN